MKKLLIAAVCLTSTLVSANVWDKIKPSADFRYRLENTKDDFNGEAQSRQRIRARVGLNYIVDDTTQIKIRLATTGAAASTNDTLGDSTGAAGAVFFDRAYIAHKAGDVEVNMGRMAFPMFKAGKTQLLWDADLNPEGIHAGYKWMGAYINLGSFWVVEEKSNTANDGIDVTITSSQLGYANMAGELAYNIGVSNYHYENAHADGNSFSASAEGMNILETYLELKWKKVTVFYSSVVNNEAQEDNKANIIGLSYGKAKAKGDWKIGANSRTVELNSIYNKFMDGDFAGQTTDSSGTIVYAKYMTTDHAYLSFGMFANTKNVDEKADTTKESESYTKLQIDYGIKF